LIKKKPFIDLLTSLILKAKGDRRDAKIAKLIRS